MTGDDRKRGAPLLDVEGVSVRFGGLQALRDVTLEVGEGEIVGVIGPNGAGKSTLFNVITGLLPPTAGRVRVRGEDVTRWPTHRRVQGGMTKTSQKVQVFEELSVLENLVVGAMLHEPRLARAREEALATLEFLGLADLRRRPARDLTLAERARLELGRALAVRPRIVLLDELMAGLNAVEVEETLDRLRQVNEERGVALVVIEHNVRAVMTLCRRVTVLNFGQVIATGPPEEIARHPDVIQAYLGGAEA